MNVARTQGEQSQLLRHSQTRHRHFLTSKQSHRPRRPWSRSRLHVPSEMLLARAERLETLQALGIVRTQYEVEGGRPVAVPGRAPRVLGKVIWHDTQGLVPVFIDST